MLYAKRDAVKGPYIIGMPVNDGTVQFAKRPFAIYGLDKATSQAKVLADKFDKPYSVYGVLSEVLPYTGIRKAAVEDTFQKENGKYKKSIVSITADWQKIIAGSDLSRQNIPVSLTILASGNIKVGYSLSGTSEVFENMSKAMEFIADWIKNHKADK